jgi:DnaK suppressor protein
MVVRNPEVLLSILEGERAQLQAVIAESEPEGGRNLGLGNHMADDASEAYEQAKEMALHQNAARLLHQVEEALARLEQGTYGDCEHCGQTIDPARLEALPYAILCMHCQQRQGA